MRAGLILALGLAACAGTAYRATPCAVAELAFVRPDGTIVSRCVHRLPPVCVRADADGTLRRVAEAECAR